MSHLDQNLGYSHFMLNSAVVVMVKGETRMPIFASSEVGSPFFLLGAFEHQAPSDASPFLYASLPGSSLICHFTSAFP